MNNEQVNDLISVLEDIRKEKYPDIPSELIVDIVKAQFENQNEDDVGNRRSNTVSLIQSFLNTITVEQED